jgi:uncharacterized protein (TIGR02677 family)
MSSDQTRKGEPTGEKATARAPIREVAARVVQRWALGITKEARNDDAKGSRPSRCSGAAPDVRGLWYKGRHCSPSMAIAILRVFAHLNADKAEIYRAVLGAFVVARQRFLIHLRPAEIGGHAVDPGRIPGEVEIGPVLDQLCEWGNLGSHPDTAEVRTVEEFNRPRFLYQLTPEGEAAEQAIALFHEVLATPPELQTEALRDIRDLLAELSQLAVGDKLDEAKVHRTLLTLTQRFEALTDRAQAFMRSLQTTIQLRGADVAALVSYKETLIEYLERFIGQLVVSRDAIAASLTAFEAACVDRLLDAVARRELADRLDAGPDDQRGTRAAWQARWDGLCRWFVEGADGPSQASLLQARARAAIPALLTAVSAVHDRRVTRSDRVADLRTLARWFAAAADAPQAHRLFRAAFGLTQARHLRIDPVTLEARETEPVRASTSWLEAPPLRLSPRLRSTGSHVRRGRPCNIVDRSQAKAELRRLAEEEAEQIELAWTRMVGWGRVRLSVLGRLDPHEFDLLLDLLDEALSVRSTPGEFVETTSSDGSFRVALEPTGDGATAVIETSAGTLRGPDHYITVAPAHAERGGATADPSESDVEAVVA